MTKLERGILYIPTSVAPTAEVPALVASNGFCQTLSDDSRQQLDRFIADSIITRVGLDRRDGGVMLSFNSPSMNSSTRLGLNWRTGSKSGPAVE